MSEIIKEHFNDSYFTQSAIYEVLDQRNYRLKQKSGRQSSVSDLHLTLNGNSIKTIVKNDSVASYYLKFKDFSLKYGLDDDVDIYAKYGAREFSSVNPIPINLLFLKRNKFVYFIVLSVYNLNMPLHEDTLYRLLKF